MRFKSGRFDEGTSYGDVQWPGGGGGGVKGQERDVATGSR